QRHRVLPHPNQPRHRTRRPDRNLDQLVRSIVVGSPRALALALVALRGEAAFLGRAGRPRLAPRLRSGGGGGEQRDQPVERVAPVLLLRAESLRLDDDDAVLGHAPSRETGEALVLRTAQRRAIGRIEAQLRGARHLVDVLAAWTGGGDESELYRTVIDRQVCGDAEHYDLSHGPRRRHGTLPESGTLPERPIGRERVTA